MLDDVGMPFELVADRRPDEIGAVRIKPLLHHEIDVAEIHEAEVDRDFSVSGVLGRSSRTLAAITVSIFTIQSDGGRMLYGSEYG